MSLNLVSVQSLLNFTGYLVSIVILVSLQLLWAFMRIKVVPRVQILPIQVWIPVLLQELIQSWTRIWITGQVLIGIQQR